MEEVGRGNRPLRAHRLGTPRTNDHEQRTIFVEEPNTAKGRFYCPFVPWGFSHKCGRKMARRGILRLVPNSAPELHSFSLPAPLLPPIIALRVGSRQPPTWKSLAPKPCGSRRRRDGLPAKGRDGKRVCKARISAIGVQAFSKKCDSVIFLRYQAFYWRSPSLRLEYQIDVSSLSQGSPTGRKPRAASFCIFRVELDFRAGPAARTRTVDSE